MPYSVPPLPYDYAALEPHIDEQTMQIHHDKHHQAYVDQRQRRARGHRVGRQADRGRHPRPPEGPGGQARGRPQPRWRAPQPLALLDFMSPTGGGAPSGDLAAAIDAKFGSFDAFKDDVQGRRHQPVRLGLGLARQGRSGARGRLDGQPGQPGDQRHGAAPRRRRLGARVLPQLPEPSPGLPRRVVERRQLGAASPSASAPRRRVTDAARERASLPRTR